MALIELLTIMKDLDKGHPLNRRLDSEAKFEGGSAELYARVIDILSDHRQINIEAVCSAIVDAVADDSFQSFFQALSSTLAPSVFVEEDNGGDDSDCSLDPQNRVLMNFKEAFNWPFQDGQSLEAFEEYLDVQWLEMCRLYQPAKNKWTGTRLSRVGSIIQSSCTGKSRLAQEYLPRFFYTWLKSQVGQENAYSIREFPSIH